MRNFGNLDFFEILETWKLGLFGTFGNLETLAPIGVRYAPAATAGVVRSGGLWVVQQAAELTVLGRPVDLRR